MCLGPRMDYCPDENTLTCVNVHANRIAATKRVARRLRLKFVRVRYFSMLNPNDRIHTNAHAHSRKHARCSTCVLMVTAENFLTANKLAVVVNHTVAGMSHQRRSSYVSGMSHRCSRMHLHLQQRPRFQVCLFGFHVVCHLKSICYTNIGNTIFVYLFFFIYSSSMILRPKPSGTSWPQNPKR